MAHTNRAETLARLKEKQFDLLVLGGGITGAGIARDAALRGLSVALVEKRDLATGTSSASSKLIHGGLRYLEQYELGLVFESVSERGRLMQLAPHLARPMPFLFPVYETSRRGMFMVGIGMWAYDLLARFKSYRRHRMLNRKRASEAEPGLLAKGLKGAARYYDCMTDDARLTLETAVDAVAHGGVVATYIEAVSITDDGAGHTTGLMVRDRLGDEPGEPFPVRARVVVVAAGPWTDEVLGDKVQGPLLRPTKGSHIVLERSRLAVDHAVVLTGPRDNRVMFAIPWGERTIVGTTDTDEERGPDDLEASGADVDYLLEAVNAYFPELDATRADVISTWSGLRPLMSDSESEHASDVSREHQIINLDPGLLAIVGGKLTTYRLMAEQVVDRALQKLGHRKSYDPCRTNEVPLPGAEFPHLLRDLPAYARELAREYALDEPIALHLAQTYGVRARAVLQAGKDAGVRPGRLVPDLPYLVDEVVFAAEEELALRLDDVLRRRTLIFLKDRDQGLGVAEEAAQVMGQVLGWDEQRVAAEVARYGELVAASRAWRSAVAAPQTAT